MTAPFDVGPVQQPDMNEIAESGGVGAGGRNGHAMKATVTAVIDQS
jgi:hypothetical protein